MKIFLVGATGKTGSIFLNRALDNGHIVTVYVRSPEKIKESHDNLKIIEGSMLSIESLTNAMQGHNVVISCLGGEANKKSSIISDMTMNIVKAMKTNGIKRIASIATAGVHDEFSFFTSLIVKVFYKHVINDHKGAVECILSNNLDYTIARPLSLIDGSLTKEYRCTDKGVPKGGKNISREDLAYFLLDAIENDKYMKETVGLAY